MRSTILLEILLFAAHFSTPLTQAAESKPVTKGAVTVELGATHTKFAGDSTFWVALRMSLQPGWHTYWINPGSAGEPVQILWNLPPELTASEIRWPIPARIPNQNSNLVSYGYEDEVLLWTEFHYKKPQPTPENSGSTSSFTSPTIRATIRWISCKETCIPGFAKLELPLNQRQTAPAVHNNEFWQRQLERTQSSWPTRISPEQVKALGFSATLTKASTTEPTIQLDFNDLSSDKAQAPLHDFFFFPKNRALISPDYVLNDQSPPQAPSRRLIFRDSKLLPSYLETIETVSAKQQVISGILSYKNALGETKGVEVDVPATIKVQFGAIKILFLAWLGGLLLNLMPCVFPVLALKALHLTRTAKQKPQEMRLELGLFSAGLLSSFVAMGATLIILRAAGERIGWGFQLQSPTFIAFLAWLFTVLALNLLGIFELGTRWMGIGSNISSRQDRVGMFFSGVLATVVATPCTAPFMGTSLGVALTAPPFYALLIFVSLGVGMLSPYLVFALFPSLAAKLPKPGRWMELTKQVLGFPLLLTAVWLIWTYGSQTSNTAVGILLGCLTFTGFALWLLRLEQNRTHHTSLWPVGWVVVSLSLILTLLASSRQNGYSHNLNAREIRTVQDLIWNRFSSAEVQKALSSGHSVFIDFTASWCITCQVNESLVLSSQSVLKHFSTNKVNLFRADWTNQDPEITNELEKYGVAGVPLYIFISAKTKEPKVLPNLLTPDLVISLSE